MTKLKIGLRVSHEKFGQGIIVGENPCQVEFQPPSWMAEFNEFQQGQLTPENVSQMDHFELGDYVVNVEHGSGRVVQKNNVTGELTVLFNSVQDSVVFRQFPMDTPLLRKA